MVLQYHGIRTMQQDIVARTFGTDAQGNLPNQAGDLANITSNLNNLNVDRAGTTYQVESVFGEGAPPIELLLDNMERREPLIIVSQLEREVALEHENAVRRHLSGER